MKKKLLRIIMVSSLVLGAITVGNTTVQAATRDGWYKNGHHWELYQQNQMVRDTWAKVDGIWYHFDENGAMQTGWLKDEGQ